MERTFTARDILTYLCSEATSWSEDVDGDCEDGVTRVYVNHEICVRDGLLDELLDMAGIKKAWGESTLEALRRATEEDEAKAAAEAV